MEFLHTMVRVSDVEASLRFYCEGLGLKEIRRTDSEQGRFTLIFLASPDDLKRGGFASGSPMRGTSFTVRRAMAGWRSSNRPTAYPWNFFRRVMRCRNRSLGRRWTIAAAGRRQADETTNLTMRSARRRRRPSAVSRSSTRPDPNCAVRPALPVRMSAVSRVRP